MTYEIHCTVFFARCSAYSHIVFVNLCGIFSKDRHNRIKGCIEIIARTITGKLESGMHYRLTSTVYLQPRGKWIEPADSWLVRMNRARSPSVEKSAADRLAVILWLLVGFALERNHGQGCDQSAHGFLFLPA